jgi:predicted metal-binding membrane protein
MLVMFGIGMGNLGWMVALTVMMASESAVPNVRHSRTIRLAVGVVLLLLAGLWLAHPVWLVPVAAS